MNRWRRHSLRLETAVLVAAFTVLVAAHVASAADSGKSKASRANVARSELVDINHANVDELKTLPGIQQAYADKIVKNRPYANKAQLSSKGVIPAATYRKIRTLIIAKQ